jgi:hypothetical protein
LGSVGRAAILHSANYGERKNPKNNSKVFFSCTIMFDALCKYSFGDAVGKKGKKGICFI